MWTHRNRHLHIITFDVTYYIVNCKQKLTGQSCKYAHILPATRELSLYNEVYIFTRDDTEHIEQCEKTIYAFGTTYFVSHSYLRNTNFIISYMPLYTPQLSSNYPMIDLNRCACSPKCLASQSNATILYPWNSNSYGTKHLFIISIWSTNCRLKHFCGIATF